MILGAIRLQRDRHVTAGNGRLVSRQFDQRVAAVAVRGGMRRRDGNRLIKARHGGLEFLKAEKRATAIVVRFGMCRLDDNRSFEAGDGGREAPQHKESGATIEPGLCVVGTEPECLVIACNRRLDLLQFKEGIAAVVVGVSAGRVARNRSGIARDGGLVTHQQMVGIAQVVVRCGACWVNLECFPKCFDGASRLIGLKIDDARELQRIEIPRL